MEEWMWGIGDVIGKVAFSSSLVLSNFLTMDQRRLIVMHTVEQTNRCRKKTHPLWRCVQLHVLALSTDAVLYASALGWANPLINECFYGIACFAQRSCITLQDVAAVCVHVYPYPED
jgi:hypothetical protein